MQGGKLSMEEGHVKAIKEWEPPTKVIEFHSFLGLSITIEDSSRGTLQVHFSSPTYLRRSSHGNGHQSVMNPLMT